MLPRDTLRDWGRSLLWLLLFATPVVFSRATTEAFEYPKLALIKAAALVFLAGALLVPRAVDARLRDPIVAGVLSCWGAAALSTLFSVSPRTSLLGAEGSFAGLLTLTAFVVLFFAARTLCTDAASARAALAAALAGVGVSIAYGGAQLLGFDPLRWKAPIVFSGVSRVFSTQGHPNSLAQILALALPLALYFLQRALRERRLDAAFGYGFVALGGAGLALLTLSRAGVVAIAAALVVLLVGAAKSRRWLVVTSLAGALALGLGLAALSDAGAERLDALARRLAGRGGDGVEQDPRWFLWAGAWSTFREQPVLGAGPETFALTYAARRPPEAWRAEWGQTAVKAHNQLLELLATRGLLGAAAALWLVCGVARALRHSRDDAFLALAAFAGLVAFAVHTLFHFPTAAGTLLASTLLAIVSRLSQPAIADVAPTRVPAWRMLAVGALLVPALLFGVLRPLRADVLCRAATDVIATDPSSAAANAEQALRLDSSRALLWQRLSAAYQGAARAEREASLRRHLFESARHAAQEAVRRESSAYAHAHLGTILSDLERETPPLAQRAEVEQAFEHARARDPNNSFVHTAAATAALVAGDREGVRRWAQLCLVLYPDFAPPRALLGAARLYEGRRLLAAGEKERARAELETAALLLRESAAGNWRGDEAARRVASENRLAAMRALAALD
jgi:O-antigen ligase